MDSTPEPCSPTTGPLRGANGVPGLPRTPRLLRAVETLSWDKMRSPTAVDESDVIEFSYSGRYASCQDGKPYTVADAPFAQLMAAGYQEQDTCSGIADAAARLAGLLRRLAADQPDVSFDLVGHSMGGMVAAYLVATERDSALLARIHRVVTLDSPLQGFSVLNPLGICRDTSSSGQDILGRSPVVGVINGMGQAGRAKLVTMKSSLIGSGLVGGPPPVQLACGEGSPLPWLSAGAHGCGFQDPVALQVIADAVNRVGE